VIRQALEKFLKFRADFSKLVPMCFIHISILVHTTIFSFKKLKLNKIVKIVSPCHNIFFVLAKFMHILDLNLIKNLEQVDRTIVGNHILLFFRETFAVKNYKLYLNTLISTLVYMRHLWQLKIFTSQVPYQFGSTVVMLKCSNRIFLLIENKFCLTFCVCPF
jgi:hypothetical protein